MKKSKVEFSTLAIAEEAYTIVGERAEDDVAWNDKFLDNAVGPLQVGGLYTFAARKGTGKSFSLLRQALMLDVPSVFVSLEDPIREVGRRVHAAPVAQGHKDRVKLYIPERPRLSEVGGALAASGARVWFIDYLQVLQDDLGISTFDRAGQVRNVITELKSLARKHHASVVLAAQLKRPPVQVRDPYEEDPFEGGEPRGTIYDIRDSSDVENQSEAVILIHRLGRLGFDQTVGAVKSRCGGERRKFQREKGGWPVVVVDNKKEESYDTKVEAKPDPFADWDQP